VQTSAIQRRSPAEGFAGFRRQVFDFPLKLKAPPELHNSRIFGLIGGAHSAIWCASYLEGSETIEVRVVKRVQGLKPQVQMALLIAKPRQFNLLLKVQVHVPVTRVIEAIELFIAL
jgi:hypothetical protein